MLGFPDAHEQNLGEVLVPTSESWTKLSAQGEYSARPQVSALVSSYYVTETSSMFSTHVSLELRIFHSWL